MEPVYISAFPDAATGFYAMAGLLATSSYQKLTIEGAINRYAPPNENYEKYVWVTVGDDKVRPEHEALDGEIRTWYDTPHPGEEYGCRCHAESVD